MKRQFIRAIKLDMTLKNRRPTNPGHFQCLTSHGG
jgi:hypothetical protein